MSNPEPTEQRWAFKCLVRREDDFVGLIAYGLYKKRKSDLADHHRANGCSEEEIKQKVKDYHAMVVTGDAEIERFKRDAKNLLDQMMDATAEAIKNGHKEEIASLAHQHQKAIDKAKKQAIDDVARTAKNAIKNDQRWPLKFLFWLISGVPSAAATIVLAALIFGVMAIFGEPSDRGKLASGMLNKAVGEEIVKPTTGK